MLSHRNLKQVEAGTMQAFIILSIIGAGLCQKTTNEMKADWDYEIKQQYKLFAKYYNGGDLYSLETLFTDDCIMMPPGFPQATGREASMDAPATLWGTGEHNLTIIPVEVTAEKQRIAIDRGLFIISNDDKGLYDTGKYIAIWKRVNGVPKIYTNIWNSSIQ